MDETIYLRELEPLLARLRAKTTVGETGCWEWQGTLYANGYGQIKLATGKPGGRAAYVHRLSWQLHFGQIPKGVYVCHRCDNRLCWNPSHLWLGSNRENRLDSVAKRRHAHGESAGGAKLTDQAVLEIRRAFAEGAHIADLARRYGRATSTIEHVVYRRSWKHLP